MTDSPGMGLREFGRQVGVSGEAIRKAIKTGRIPMRFVGQKALSTGRLVPVIADPPGAAHALRANTDPSMKVAGEKISAGKKAAASVSLNVLMAAKNQQPQKPAPKPREPGDVVMEDGELAPSLVESRQVAEAYNAKMAKLKYEQAAGKLADAEELKLKYSNMVTAARGRMLSVPSKAKGRIPHLTLEEVELLDGLIREGLEDCAGADGR